MTEAERRDRFWVLLRLTIGLLTRLLLRPRVRGRTNVPRSGPLLLVSNHQSFWDIPLIGAVQPRTVCYMAKHELFGIPLLGAFIRRGGGFPVRRGEPDRAALRRVHEIMQEDGVVGIFIEGHRYAEIAEAKAGAGRCAVVEAVPVVPVAVRGTRNWRPFRRAAVAFGEPRTFERGDRRPGEAYRAASDELMEVIRALYEGLA